MLEVGKIAPAGRLYGASAALRSVLGAKITVSNQEKYDQPLAAVRLGSQASLFDAAWAHGTALNWEQATDYALALNEQP